MFSHFCRFSSTFSNISSDVSAEVLAAGNQMKREAVIGILVGICVEYDKKVVENSIQIINGWSYALK